MRYNNEILEKKISELASLARDVSGIYYRIVKSLYANEVLSGIGAKKHSPGRWMQLGVCYVLYTSSSIETALKEAIRPEKESLNLYTLATLELTCSKVLNLNKYLKFLDIQKKDLLKPIDFHEEKTESITQFIGHTAFKAGINGLIVPSSADQTSNNLVLFSKNTPVPNVKVINKTELRA